MHTKLFTFSSLIVLLFTSLLAAKGPAYIDPKKVDDDYAYQGEYTGTIQADQEIKVGVQVIALGQKKFRGVVFMGGLPGDGWNGAATISTEAEMKDGKIHFQGDQADGVIKEKGEMIVQTFDGDPLGTLKRVERKSKTLGAKPPEGAKVLFDGTSAKGWKNGKVENELLVQGTTSEATFGSHHLHIEFRLPYQPQDRGQARGNSGLYLQGRYEVQMLDSFGLAGKNNECGGIYSIKDPDLNMCYPPLQWQTYDVEFTAAKYEDGKVVSNPRMTVKHNGVVVHDNVELPKSTTAAPMKPGPEPGPIYLQNHSNPVRYRNIWVVEK